MNNYLSSMSMGMSKKPLTPQMHLMKVIGKAILFASMQFAIGSVEMSSKFSVKNFSKDQDTLQNAADALSDYILIGIFWTIGTSLVFYASYGIEGLIANIAANFGILAWIYYSYIAAFEQAVKANNLQMPTLFKNKWLL